MMVVDWETARMPPREVRRHRRQHRVFSAARIFAQLREWRRRTKDRARLTALDDRMLADIGITRTEANFLSDKPFWRV